VSWSQIRRRLVTTTAIGVVVGAACAWGLAADRLDGVQNRWEDLLQPGLASADDVVIVGIDRDTLAATGMAWPWPRDLHAELLDAIGDGRPAVVAYDVLFADSGPGDDVLVEAMQRTPTVLPTALTLTIGSEGTPEIVDAVVPADSLAAAAAGLGHANITNVGDAGVVRALPLYALDERGIARPSIALAAVAVADGASGPVTERPHGVQVGDRFVPLDDAELRINWSDTLAQADVVPAIDVLRGSVAADVFRDRVVLVGVTEPTLGDQHLVPTDRSGGTSGVVVIANATNTMLSSGYLGRPSTATQLGLIVVVAVGVTVMFAFVRLVPALMAALAAAAAVVLFSAWRFHTDGTLWNVVWPVLAVVLAAAAGTAWQDVTESRHRRRAWRLFATYVPAEVVRQLEDPGRLAQAVSGVRSEVTVVFCDIREFTALTGPLPPARVRELLDGYYEYTVAIIQRHGGTVMQFVGDEVFAVFGAPVANDSAATDALRCVLALQDEIASLDERLAAAGLPAARFGIGVHRGWVVAAHVGTEDRRQYAVVGETVNVGGRLCECAAAGEIVVSERVWESVAPELRHHFVAAGSIDLKGVSLPVTVYRALRASPARAEHDSAARADSNGDRHGEPFGAHAVSGPVSASGREPGATGEQIPGRDG
jgi:adenylate cyclase